MLKRPIILHIRKPWIWGALIALLALLVGAGSLKINTALSNGLKDKVIVIDPGHGGADPGAQHAGLKEKDINLDVSLRLRQVLESKGCKVILTREVDRDFFLPGFIQGRMAKRAELNKRINTASENDADLFISVHANSFPQRNTYGMETYYHVKSSAGKALADRIQKQLVQLQPDNKRKAKAGDYYLINQTKMPAVIVEVGFLSNPRERTLLQSVKYRDNLALAIGAGVEDYFSDFPHGVQESAPTLAPQEGPASAGDDTYKLYFATNNLDGLAPEDRLVNKTLWASLNLSQRVSVVLNDLIRGPQSASIAPTLASATKVRSVVVQNGIATIDFSKELQDQFPGGAIEEDIAIRSIVWSTIQLPGISGVKILINGEFGDSIGGHILLDHTFTAQPTNAKASIIIDDWGINNPGTPEMLNLKAPITAAVMPNMMFSQKESELLHQKGVEIILHMPVEPKEGRSEWLGPGVLRTQMSSEEQQQRLTEALNTVPYAIGISNHMGSKGTEDLRTVQSIIAFSKEHHLLVVDSKTSESTILGKEAHKSGLVTGTRDVFIDNIDDVNEMKKQLRTLIEKAKQSGKAIGIGHVGPQGQRTARAIQAMLPEFQKNGVQLVPLSELLDVPRP